MDTLKIGTFSLIKCPIIENKYQLGYEQIIFLKLTGTVGFEPTTDRLEGGCSIP